MLFLIILLDERNLKYYFINIRQSHIFHIALNNKIEKIGDFGYSQV